MTNYIIDENDAIGCCVFLMNYSYVIQQTIIIIIMQSNLCTYYNIDFVGKAG